MSLTPTTTTVNVNTVNLLASLANHTVNGETIALPAKSGNTFAFGEVGYIDSSGTVTKAKADVVGTTPTTVMCVDAAGIAAGASGNWLLKGIARDDSNTYWGTVTPGGYMYLDKTTAGKMINDISGFTVTGNVVQITGIGLTSHIVYFNPQLVTVVVAA